LNAEAGARLSDSESDSSSNENTDAESQGHVRLGSLAKRLRQPRPSLTHTDPVKSDSQSVDINSSDQEKGRRHMIPSMSKHLKTSKQQSSKAKEKTHKQSMVELETQNFGPLVRPIRPIKKNNPESPSQSPSQNETVLGAKQNAAKEINDLLALLRPLLKVAERKTDKPENVDWVPVFQHIEQVIDAARADIIKQLAVGIQKNFPHLAHLFGDDDGEKTSFIEGGDDDDDDDGAGNQTLSDGDDDLDWGNDTLITGGDDDDGNDTFIFGDDDGGNDNNETIIIFGDDDDDGNDTSTSLDGNSDSSENGTLTVVDPTGPSLVMSSLLERPVASSLIEVIKQHVRLRRPSLLKKKREHTTENNNNNNPSHDGLASNINKFKRHRASKTN